MFKVLRKVMFSGGVDGRSGLILRFDCGLMLLFLVKIKGPWRYVRTSFTIRNVFFSSLGSEVGRIVDRKGNVNVE